MAKEEILERFDQLAQQYRWAHRIMTALISDNFAPGIVERLKRGEDYGSVARSFQDTPLASLERPITDAGAASAAAAAPMDMDYEVERVAEAVSSTSFLPPTDEHVWTRATHDPDLVHHLLELYFTWVHPIHMLLSEPHFRTSSTVTMASTAPRRWSTSSAPWPVTFSRQRPTTIPTSTRRPTKACATASWTKAGP